MRKTLKIVIEIFFPVLIILFLIWIYLHYHLSDYLNLDYFLTQKTYFDNLAFKGILVVLAIYAAVGLIYIPIAFLSLFSGYLYGFLFGGFIAYIGSVINMIVAFLWARFLLKNLFIKLKSKIKILNKASDQLKNNSKTFIFYSRLFFIAPYNALNAVCAISDVTFKDYFIYSSAGAVIQAFFYSYMGNAVEDIMAGKNITKQIIITLIVLVFFVGFIKLGKKAVK